nr:transcription termination factor MTERF2, chloroplastic-like [Tanacetum cinerariifolium]
EEVARAIQAAMPAILEQNTEITFKMIEDRIGVHKEEKQVNEDVVVVEKLLSVMTGTRKLVTFWEVVEAAQDIENIIDKANNDIKRKRARSGEKSNNKTGKKTPSLYIGDAVSTLCMHEDALVTSTRRMKMHLSLCVDEDLQHTLSFLEMIQARRRGLDKLGFKTIK